jgi:hypothetical protein
MQRNQQARDCREASARFVELVDELAGVSGCEDQAEDNDGEQDEPRPHAEPDGTGEQ